MATWADDLAALLDAIGVERTHVHGGSMGGFIATLFAARYPDRVDRLVISGAIAKCDWMARGQFSRSGRLSRGRTAPTPTSSRSSSATKALSRSYLDESFGPEGVSDPRGRRPQRERRGLPRRMRCHDRDGRHGRALADLGADAAPVRRRRLSDTARLRSRRRRDAAHGGADPGARLHVFDGCGHGNLIERADESIQVIVDFLNG